MCIKNTLFYTIGNYFFISTAKIIKKGRIQSSFLQYNTSLKPHHKSSVDIKWCLSVITNLVFLIFSSEISIGI